MQACKLILRRFERQKYELEKRAFEEEREALISSLQQERTQLLAEKQRVLQEADQARRQLLDQQKCLARERQTYLVHRRLNPDGEASPPAPCDDDQPDWQRAELEGILKAVEYEKGTLRSERATLRRSQTKYQEQRRRLADQQQEIVRAVETLHDVERAIETRLRGEAAAVKDAAERLRTESQEMMAGGTDAIEERMLAAMEEIQVEKGFATNFTLLYIGRREIILTFWPNNLLSNILSLASTAFSRD